MKTLVGLTLAVVVSLMPLSAQAYEPHGGAIFNHPTGTYNQRWALMTHVEKAIDHTPRGAEILIATYYLDRETSVNKLIAAHKRGVHVKVAMDGNGDGSTDTISGPAQRLRRALNKDPNNTSSFVACQGSCRGGSDSRNMHSKFFAFSRTGTASDVVMLSSANLNRGGALLGWNDLFTINNKPAIYAKFAKIHAEMLADTRAADMYQTDSFGNYATRFFPGPAAGPTVDPTRQDLRQVRCHGVTGGAGRAGRTAINVSMFYWGKTRGMLLAKRLVELQRQGCVVTIIYGAPTRDVSTLLRRVAKNTGLTLYDSRYDRNYDGQVDLRVHSKYLLINGNYKGDSSNWHVTTGSQNWSGGSLTGGDEVTLSIKSRMAYAQYMRNFSDIRRMGARKVG